MNMRGAITVLIIIIISILLITQSIPMAKAEKVYGIIARISGNGEFKIEKIETVDGKLVNDFGDVDFSSDDFFVIQALDESGRKAYEIFKPIESDAGEEIAYITIPFNGSRYLSVLKNGYENEILFIDLENICNGDMICNGFETESVCPDECSEAGIYTKPDAVAGKENGNAGSKNESKNNMLIYFAIGLLAIFLVIIALYLKSKRKGRGVIQPRAYA